MPRTYGVNMDGSVERAGWRFEAPGSRGADDGGAVRPARSARLERLAYTVDEAAAVVGVGRDLLYAEIRTGKLRSEKAGARRVIARHHLLEWLDGDTGKSDRRAS
jgi:excisionase family DNA binding protein